MQNVDRKVNFWWIWRICNQSNIFGGLRTQAFFSWGSATDIKIIYIVKPKVICLHNRYGVPQLEYIVQNFKKLLRKRLLGDIHWNEKNQFAKCYLVWLQES